MPRRQRGDAYFLFGKELKSVVAGVIFKACFARKIHYGARLFTEKVLVRDDKVQDFALHF